MKPSALIFKRLLDFLAVLYYNIIAKEGKNKMK